MSKRHYARAGARAKMAPCNWRGSATVALLLLLLICSAHAHSIPDKRAEMSPVPFVMGSRYGRSSPVRSLSPRNDRFFMGGRYGKRSEPPSVLDAPSRTVRPAGGEAGGAPARALLCQYTGVYPLYRCVPRTKHNGFDKRKRTEDTGPGEDV